MTNPAVSRAAAQAYDLFPDVREQIPPADVEDMETLDDLFGALGEIDETYPARLVAEGQPERWIGVGEPADYAELDDGAEVSDRS